MSPFDVPPYGIGVLFPKAGIRKSAKRLHFDGSGSVDTPGGVTEFQVSAKSFKVGNVLDLEI